MLKPERPSEAQSSHPSCMETFEGFLEEAAFELLRGVSGCEPQVALLCSLQVQRNNTVYYIADRTP